MLKRLMLALLLSVASVMADPIAYALNDTNQLYTIDIATGAETYIGDTGIVDDVEAIAFDPTSGILYVAEDDGGGLYTVDPSTGAATLVGSTGVGGQNSGMAFDAGGQGYLVTNDGLFSFDKSTGAATYIGYDGDFSGAAFVGSTLYASPDNGYIDSLVTMDTATGDYTVVGPFGFAPGNQTGLTYDAATDTLYMLDESTTSIYSVNYITGAATLVTSYTEEFEGFAIKPPALPVPAFSSLGLAVLGFAMGIFGMAMGRRRTLHG